MCRPAHGGGLRAHSEPGTDAGERRSCKTPARGLNDAEDAPGSGSVLAGGPAGDRGDGSEGVAEKQVNQTRPKFMRRLPVVPQKDLC